MKVCVIGGGAAGLCAVRHLARDTNLFEIKAFEQTYDIGGTWVYTDKTGTDENGLPIHTSMYKNLRTNLPGKIMDFPDFPKLGSNEKSCLTHKEVLQYLHDYAKQFDLKRYFQFFSRVENVTVNNNSTFDVEVRNVQNGEVEKFTFDAVLVCNGHYFKPFIPKIPGVETFSGLILHSHTYRKPEEFAGKTVVVLGASNSGIDISNEISDYAFHVYLSHNKPSLSNEFPHNITEVSGVSSIKNNVFELNDGSSVTADTFIYCTGYEYSFPFLDNELGIKVDNNYVFPLYQHMINVNYPNMSIIGIPSTVVPFPLFHMQVQYFIATLKGDVQLPEKTEMLENSKLKTNKKKHAHVFKSYQWNYNDELAHAGHFEPLPSFYKTVYEVWSNERRKNVWYFKDVKLKIREDGNVQILYN